MDDRIDHKNIAVSSGSGCASKGGKASSVLTQWVLKEN
jgi:cysteine sulfinate desulfinase/cysteine desulfurase-like protein